MNIAFMASAFFTSIFIFDHIDRIGLWNKQEFLFFLSFVFAVEQTHYLFFSFNFWLFSEHIRMGTLDFLLLKPFSSLFIVFFRKAATSGIVTVFLSYLMMIYFGSQLEFGFLTWLSIPICVLLALFFFLGIEVFISLFNFLTIQGHGINDLRIQMQQFLKWPDRIYWKKIRLWLLPYLAITSVPASWILNFSYWRWMVILLLSSILLWILVLFLWPRFLKLYESASS